MKRSGSQDAFIHYWHFPIKISDFPETKFWHSATHEFRMSSFHPEKLTHPIITIRDCWPQYVHVSISPILASEQALYICYISLENFFLWIWNQETRIHFNLDFLSNGNPFPLVNTPKGPDTHETRWRLMYNTVFVPPGEMDLKAASRINCRLRNPDCMLCCSYWETAVKYNDQDSETNSLFRF